MSKIHHHAVNILGFVASIIVVASIIGIIAFVLNYFTSFKKDITMNDVKIEILTEGAGVGAKIGDEVVVNYAGSLVDGKEFDNSFKRGQPFPVTIGAGQVIKGWEIGLQGIKVGERRKLTIPPQMAYGDREVGNGLIPANSTLIFEVEAVSIHPRI
jgi:FKBP-type peptidyl-prolyl cis-trans isomerase